ncbi:hypothetical protein TNCV_1248881 [Trichonephila clavipes]|nr:hypothetical protein TNCV_1248881 [Trichonephila clavipes]
MRAKAYSAHPSIHDHWALRCMSICLKQVVSLKLDPQCLSPQASLVLIYRPTTVGIKADSTLPNPGIEPGPVVWKCDTLPLNHLAHTNYNQKQINVHDLQLHKPTAAF